MKLDTISLSLHTDYIIKHDKRNYNHAKIIKPNTAVIDNYSLVTNTFGFENVSINETYQTVNLKFNSKILKDNYHKGICIDTLDQIIYEIEKQGLKLDPTFLYDSNVKMIHVTDDIFVSQPTMTYINALNNLLASKFYKTLYNEGIVFKEAIKNEGLYITFYGKEFQMTSDKRFFKSNPNQIDHFRNKLRMETKLSTRKTIHKHLGSLTLPEILTSESPNGIFLDKIINNQLSYPSSLPIGNLTLTQERNYIYAKNLYEYYDGNRRQIIHHFKDRLSIKTNPTYQISQLDVFLAIIANEKDDTIKDLLDEIRFKLTDTANIAA